MLAIIGGSGLARLPILDITHRQVVRTPFGAPSCALTFGRMSEAEVIFIARHGYGHSLAPHEINYRANIWALKQQPIDAVIAISAVAGIRPDMVPGALAVPEDVIDYTWGRQHTFFEGLDKPVVHVDFAQPYTAKFRHHLLVAGRHVGIPLIDGGVYACTQGPRLESAAEINRLAKDGADMVGMTGMPEAALARELGLPYALLAVVAKPGAGTAPDSVAAVNKVLDQAMHSVQTILQRVVVTEKASRPRCGEPITNTDE